MRHIKNVVILGSTGSIGINTLKVIESFPDRFRVMGLSSFSNTKLLAQQINKHRPSSVCVVESSKAKELKTKVKTRGVKFFSDTEGLEVLASAKDADIIVIAISGAPALYPLLASIKAGKHIALANKESIVMAGSILMKEAKKHKASLIPVDSEHSAIFQCIGASRYSAINRIYLTGSGGSLHKVARCKLSSVKMEQVLKHPKWKMGKKITVDSATLMNKGLEMIEASCLFNLPIDKIKLLIHPEAIVHSMVEFIDGSIIAQLGVTDMRLPIQYALTFPERVKSSVASVDFSQLKRLNFFQPNTLKYPCLSLAAVAAKLGRTYPAVLNAADETAVKAFLEKRINFTRIPAVIEKVLLRHKAVSGARLSDIIQADRWAREETSSLC